MIQMFTFVTSETDGQVGDFVLKVMSSRPVKFNSVSELLLIHGPLKQQVVWGLFVQYGAINVYRCSYYQHV